MSTSNNVTVAMSHGLTVPRVVYERCYSNLILAAMTLLVLLLPHCANAALNQAVSVQSASIIARCIQTDVATLDCDYRPTSASTVDGVQANLGELELASPEIFEFPQPGATAAVLFLIDTSDPNRRAAVRAGVKHIKRIVSAGSDYHLFGLAAFDSDLNLLAEPGASASQLNQALGKIRAGGRTTELYRNALAALRLLAALNADRKSLIILSDGLAEDRAYFHADVVAKARTEGITIDGLGYPRSVSLSVGLQTLRRLAEETGGVFVEGNRNFALSEDYLSAPFANSDGGGTAVFDLQLAIDAGAVGKVPLNLEWLLNGTTERSVLPIELPIPPAPVPELVVIKVPVLPTQPDVQAQTTATPLTSDGAEPATIDPSGAALLALATTAASAPSTLNETQTPATSSSSPAAQLSPVSARVSRPPPRLEIAVAPFLGELDSLQDWLWLISALLGIVLMGLAWGLYVVLRKRPVNADSENSQRRAVPVMELAQPESRQTYAYLEGVDDGERYPINSAAFRIGRHADNELPIDDASISRHHAQIHRKRDGTFSISDLESMNGVFVNDQRLPTSPLVEGDLVELGDIRLRFTMLAIDSLDGDETVMVRTHIPGKFGNAA